MSGFLTKFVLTSLILFGSGLSAFAQNIPDSSALASDRGASFLPVGTNHDNSTLAFSGLATAPNTPPVPLANSDPAPEGTPTTIPVASTPPIPISSIVPIPLASTAPIPVVKEPTVSLPLSSSANPSPSVSIPIASTASIPTNSSAAIPVATVAPIPVMTAPAAPNASSVIPVSPANASQSPANSGGLPVISPPTLSIPSQTQTPPSISPTPVVTSAPPAQNIPAPKSAVIPPMTTGSDPVSKKLDLVPVSQVTLPNVSAEAIGIPGTGSLGADMWKGTARPVAEHLMEIIAPTDSSLLNLLMLQVFKTAAVPPEGNPSPGKSLTGQRVEKLIAFGDAQDAWSLAKSADPKLLDDFSYTQAAENTLVDVHQDLCEQALEIAKQHPGADWQKLLIICQLRAKDTKAAQVALDVYRVQTNRDNIFLSIADKNVLSGSKILPFQLTPLTPTSLALLQMTNLPLPGELYAHPDFALIRPLLQASAQQDIAQIALAERAAERGIISSAELEAVYRTINFSPDTLASPLTSHETGLRLRALLFRASDNEKDPVKRILLDAKFIQSCTPAFLNGAGAITADILGPLKVDPTLSAQAPLLARIYMLADKPDRALDWLKMAQSSNTNMEDLQNLWPQFALAGLQSESTYDADFDRWFDITSKAADPQTMHDNVAATLLLLDAAGLKVSDAAWAKILMVPHNEKHASFSPALFERMQAAAAANRKAETLLLAGALAGDGEISLPAAIGITRALRLIGLHSESATFARHMVALLVKSN